MTVLDQYKLMVDKATTKRISEWLENGDYTLIAVNRLVLDEQLQEGKATDQDKELIYSLDTKMKDVITKDQLAYFADDFPEMPFKKWWA